MEKFYKILDLAIEKEATDIHLTEKIVPTFRIHRALIRQFEFEPLTIDELNAMKDMLMENDSYRKSQFARERKLDISIRYNNTKFRINISLTKAIPTLSLRLIDNQEINLKKLRIEEIVEKMKSIHNGIVLVTGKVNSGKSTTLNAYVQEINKDQSRKIVTLEDPIEYEHESKKSIVIQKEIGATSDIPTFYDGLINSLREDPDIVVVGEIRDRATMDVVLDLAESGMLVIGTLHTKSCAETIDRIINMYPPLEQVAIKYVLSATLKMVSSQRLTTDINEKLILVPEIMMVDNIIGAMIRKEKFSLSEIEDNIHAGNEKGSVSLESSLSKLYNDGLIKLSSIKDMVNKDKFDNVKRVIVQGSGSSDTNLY